jgi:hypothetical protein
MRELDMMPTSIDGPWLSSHATEMSTPTRIDVIERKKDETNVFFCLRPGCEVTEMLQTLSLR